MSQVTPNAAATARAKLDDQLEELGFSERPLPIIPMAYAQPVADNAPLNPPIPRESDAISQAFAAARETIADIESASDCWSVAQAPLYRRAS